MVIDVDFYGAVGVERRVFALCSTAKYSFSG